jgi:hypothetical protein
MWRIKAPLIYKTIGLVWGFGLSGVNSWNNLVYDYLHDPIETSGRISTVLYTTLTNLPVLGVSFIKGLSYGAVWPWTIPLVIYDSTNRCAHKHLIYGYKPEKDKYFSTRLPFLISPDKN